MLTAKQIAIKHGLCKCDEGYVLRRLIDPNCPLHSFNVVEAMIEYRNQGIQQASEVCCETLTDGFRISNVPAVLALKEEV